MPPPDIMHDEPAVTLDSSASRFEIQSEAGTAVLKFARSGQTIDLQHTSVPDALEGKGYGSALAHAALDHARQHALEVIPTCKFVRTYMERHPEYNDLRAPNA